MRAYARVCVCVMCVRACIRQGNVWGLVCQGVTSECKCRRSGGWEGERRDVRNERLGEGKISHSIHHHLLSLSTRGKHWVVFSYTELERDRWRGSGEIE